MLSHNKWSKTSSFANHLLLFTRLITVITYRYLLSHFPLPQQCHLAILPMLLSSLCEACGTNKKSVDRTSHKMRMGRTNLTDKLITWIIEENCYPQTFPEFRNRIGSSTYLSIVDIPQSYGCSLWSDVWNTVVHVCKLSIYFYNDNVFIDAKKQVTVTYSQWSIVWSSIAYCCYSDDSRSRL